MNSVLNPAVVFRRRSGWEAVDMGVFLWRTNCFPILFFTAIPMVLLFAVNIITSNSGNQVLSQITFYFIWWIKPLVDRFALHVVSIRFFEPAHAASGSFRRLFRGLGKTIKTGLAGDILWRRLSPYRSASMPVRVLERLKGNSYKRRKQILFRNGLGFGFPLTLICFCMTTALNAGELIFLNSISDMIHNTETNFFDFLNTHNNLVSLLHLLNGIIIETLYVCMGFSLYINSRVQTEGWDIELLFKTCVEKNKKSLGAAHNHTAAFAIPVLVLLFLFVQKLPAQKQQDYELLKPAPVSKDTEKLLSDILDDPKFGTEKESWRIRFKQKDEDPGWFNRMPSGTSIREVMGQFLRFAAIAGIIATLGFAVFFAYRYRSRIFPKASSGKSFMDDPSREECQKLLQQAEEYHRKGKIREAWALCLRAFISVFAKLWFVPFPAEATEYESLALVRSNYSSIASSDSVKLFEDFIHRWIIFAYGGKEPQTGSFEQAVASCKTLLEHRERSA